MQFIKLHRKGIDTLVCLVVWLVWKERTRMVHDPEVLLLVALVAVIMERHGTDMGASGFFALEIF